MNEQEGTKVEAQSGELTLLEANPPQAIASKPGYLTSQFGLTAVFTVIVTLLGYAGITTTHEQLDGYLAFGERMAALIVPFLALLGGVVTYINSRGKIASNTVNANAAVQVASVAGIPGIGATLGGKNWKDPKRYANIADMLAPFIPGGQFIDRATDIVQGEQSTNEQEQGLTVEEMRILKELLRNATNGK